MLANPLISVIVPVYNAANYLEESLNCLRNQTFHTFEIICVDDGSTDGSMDILKRYAHEDERFIILSQCHKGAGAARNKGLEFAGGYIIFLDSDDLFLPGLLEKTYAAALDYQADIVAFNYTRFDEEGKHTWYQGIHTKWLPEGKLVFNYTDCPGLIMRVINPTPWNKLYRKDFILENQLKFEEISSTNDITFAAVSAACANRITYIEDALVQYRIGHTGSITSNKAAKLNNVHIAIESAVRQAKALPYGKEILSSIYRFSIENYLFALKNYIVDFDTPQSEQFYTIVHTLFSSEELDGLTAEMINSQQLFQEFSTVRKHDYGAIRALWGRKMIVSLTSYPERIHGVADVLESLYAQTLQADEIVLWLAADQFPDKEEELPDALRELSRANRLTIRWCDDLKPHKKYFYALQEYKDAAVVTIDDDLIYPAHMLENLHKSYLLYPDAVSTVRAHLIVISENGEILPYSYWIKELDICLHKPSMQLLATGGAGTLYPPNLFSQELFHKDIIMEACPFADDLWLKTMELLSDVPVVVAQPFEKLHYLPGSQEMALYHENVDLGQNDVQLAHIRRYLENAYGRDVFAEKVTLPIGERLLGIKCLCQCFDKERRLYKERIRELDDRLHRTYQEKSEINSKLQQTYHEKSEINAKLQITYKEKADRGIRIKALEADKAKQGKKIKKLKAEIASLQEKNNKSFLKKSRECLRRIVKKLRKLFLSETRGWEK